MNLKDYPIYESLNGRFIDFGETGYSCLGSLLNSLLHSYANLDSILEELNYLQYNWGNENMERFVEEKRGGYFDWEILNEIRSEGKWFSIWGDIQFSIIVNQDTKTVRIYDEFDLKNSELELPFDEFVEVLEQWREVPSLITDGATPVIQRLDRHECESFIRDLEEGLKGSPMDEGFFSDSVNDMNILYRDSYIIIDKYFIITMFEMLTMLRQRLEYLVEYDSIPKKIERSLAKIGKILGITKNAK
jgi:hypothetical protein